MNDSQSSVIVIVSVLSGQDRPNLFWSGQVDWIHAWYFWLPQPLTLATVLKWPTHVQHNCNTSCLQVLWKTCAKHAHF